MAYGVRQYGVRQYGDGDRVITDATPYGGGPSDNIAGSDTVTFTETATLGTSMRANDTLTFAETGNVTAAVLLVADTAHPESNVRFSGYARLSAEAAIVPPPADVWVKRVSPTMPAPVLDARGRPT